MLKQLDQKIQCYFFTRVKQQEFLEDVSTLIEDGVPAQSAIDTMRQIYSGTNRSVAQAILTKIAEGKTIADGMEGWFPQPIVEIIRAGEEGGTLTQTLHAAANALSEQSSAISSLLASTLYPIAVIIMGAIVAVFIRHSIFVNFAAIKPMNEWPINGRALVYIADFIQDWWWLMLIILIALAFFTFKMLRNLTGETRKLVDSIPLLSLYREIRAARFMETMGLLIANGVTLKQGLQILQRHANRYLAWHIYVMQYRLSGGRENVADVLDTGMISTGDILRLRVMARGKGFDQALIHLGAQAAKRNIKNIKLTGKITGVICLFAGALWAAFMIFAMYGVGSFVGT